MHANTKANIKRTLPSRYDFGLGAPEDILVVDEAVVALALLGHHVVAADVELGAVVRVGIGRVGQDTAPGPDHVVRRTAEAVVEALARSVQAAPGRVNGPHAARHLLLVDEARRTRHHLLQGWRARVSMQGVWPKFFFLEGGVGVER